MGCGNSSNSQQSQGPPLVRQEAKPASAPPTFKVVCLGDKAVGKSCMVMRFTQDKFSEGNPSTIGYAFIAKDLTAVRGGQEMPLRLHIWDTAGEEAYKSMTKFFYRDATIGVIVYDVSNEKSFANLETWIRDFRAQCPNTPFMIVGNKIDLESSRVVSKVQVSEFLSRLDLTHQHWECSAKTGEGIQELFCEVGAMALRGTPPPVGGGGSDEKIVVRNAAAPSMSVSAATAASGGGVPAPGGSGPSR